MRRRAVQVAVLVAVLGGGWLAWHFLAPSPEQVIRKRLKQAAQVASFGPNEAPLAKLINSQKLIHFCTPEIEIAIDVPGRSVERISGQDDLLRLVTGARSSLSSLSVEFLDINVVVGPETDSAVANLTAKGRIGGDRDWYVQEMKFWMKKVGREWLIRRVETIKTLSRAYSPGLTSSEG